MLSCSWPVLAAYLSCLSLITCIIQVPHSCSSRDYGGKSVVVHSLALNSNTWGRHDLRARYTSYWKLIPHDWSFVGNDSGPNTSYLPFLPQSSHSGDWSPALHHLYSYFLPRTNLHLSGFHILTILVTAPCGALSLLAPTCCVVRCT